MRLPRTVECAIVMEPGHSGRQRLRIDASAGRSPLPPGRVPRIARLLALAHKFDGLLRQGTVLDYAALASLGQVSRARITQIMNLLYLAPDIQEEILYLPPTVHGHDPIPLTRLHAIAQILDWPRQRTLWGQLLDRHGAADSERSLDASGVWFVPVGHGGHEDAQGQSIDNACSAFPRQRLNDDDGLYSRARLGTVTCRATEWFGVRLVGPFFHKFNGPVLAGTFACRFGHQSL